VGFFIGKKSKTLEKVVDKPKKVNRVQESIFSLEVFK